MPLETKTRNIETETTAFETKTETETIKNWSRGVSRPRAVSRLTSLRAFCVYTPRTRNSPARCFRRQKLNSFQNEHPSFVPLLAAKQPQQLVDDVFVTTSTPVIFCVPLNTRSRCRQYHTFERFDPSKFAPLRSKYIRYPAISQSARTQFIITLLAAQMKLKFFKASEAVIAGNRPLRSHSETSRQLLCGKHAPRLQARRQRCGFEAGISAKSCARVAVHAEIS